jgi:hypothetical protein
VHPPGRSIAAWEVGRDSYFLSMDTMAKIEKKVKLTHIIEVLARGNRWAASPPSRGFRRGPAACFARAACQMAPHLRPCLIPSDLRTSKYVLVSVSGFKTQHGAGSSLL